MMKDFDVLGWLINEEHEHRIGKAVDLADELYAPAVAAVKAKDQRIAELERELAEARAEFHVIWCDAWVAAQRCYSDFPNTDHTRECEDAWFISGYAAREGSE